MPGIDTGPAEQAQCRLLGGPPAWIAQFVLGLIAMSALVYKRIFCWVFIPSIGHRSMSFYKLAKHCRHRERPQRPLDVWSYDVTKQLLSMLLAHICGLTIAAIVASEGKHAVSECAWYFVAFSFDTTLGVALTLAFHSFALKLARKQAPERSIAARIADCGHYGVPPQWTNFWPQMLEWLIAVLLARIGCGLVVSILRIWLTHVARVLDIMFDKRPIALLYFVMICCPLLMNLFQAVVQDMALKWRKRNIDKQATTVTDNVEKGSEVALISIRADAS